MPAIDEMFNRRAQTRAFKFARTGERFAEAGQYHYAGKCFADAAEQVQLGIGGDNPAEFLSAGAASRKYQETAAIYAKTAGECGQRLEDVPDEDPITLWRRFKKGGNSGGQVAQSRGDFIDFILEEAPTLLFWAGIIGLAFGIVCSVVALVEGLGFYEASQKFASMGLLAAGFVCGWVVIGREPASEWLETFCETIADLQEAVADGYGLLWSLFMMPCVAFSRYVAPWILRFLLSLALGIPLAGIIILGVLVLKISDHFRSTNQR